MRALVIVLKILLCSTMVVFFMQCVSFSARAETERVQTAEGTIVNSFDDEIRGVQLDLETMAQEAAVLIAEQEEARSATLSPAGEKLQLEQRLQALTLFLEKEDRLFSLVSASDANLFPPGRLRIPVPRPPVASNPFAHKLSTYDDDLERVAPTPPRVNWADTSKRHPGFDVDDYYAKDSTPAKPKPKPSRGKTYSFKPGVLTPTQGNFTSRTSSTDSAPSASGAGSSAASAGYPSNSSARVAATSRSVAASEQGVSEESEAPAQGKSDAPINAPQVVTSSLAPIPPDPVAAGGIYNKRFTWVEYSSTWNDNYNSKWVWEEEWRPSPTNIGAWWRDPDINKDVNNLMFTQPNVVGGSYIITVANSAKNPVSVSIEEDNYTFNGVTFLGSNTLFLYIKDSNTTINMANANFAGQVYLGTGGVLTLGNVSSLGTARIDLIPNGTLDMATLAVCNNISFYGGTLLRYGNYSGTLTLEADWTQNIAMTSAATVVTNAGVNYNLYGLTTAHNITYNGGTLSNYESYTGHVTTTANELILNNTFTANATVNNSTTLSLEGIVGSGSLFNLAGLNNDGIVLFDLTGSAFEANTTYTLLTTTDAITGNGIFAWTGVDRFNYWNYTLTNSGNSITLAITASQYEHDHDHLMWSMGNGTWDKANENWTFEDESCAFADGDAVLFGAQLATRTIAVIGVGVAPSHVRVELGDYIFTGGSFLSATTQFLSIASSQVTISQSNAAFAGYVDIDYGGKLTLGHVRSVGTATIKIATGGILDLGNLAVENEITYKGGVISNYDNYTGHVTVAGAGLTLDNSFHALATVNEGLTLTLEGTVGAGSLFTLAGLENDGIVTFDLTGSDFVAGRTYTLLTTTSAISGTGTFEWTGVTPLEGWIYELTRTSTSVSLSVAIAAYEHDHDHLMWSMGNGTWDKANENWTFKDESCAFADGDAVLFGAQTARRTIEVISTGVAPSHVRVEYGDYTFTSGSFLGASTDFLSIASSKSVITQANTLFAGYVNIENLGQLTLEHVNALGTARINLATGGEIDLNHLAVANNITFSGGVISNYDNYTGHVTVAGNSLTLDNSFHASATVNEGITLTLEGVVGSGSLFSLVSLENNGIVMFDLTGSTFAVDTTYTLLTTTGAITGTGSFAWAGVPMVSNYDYTLTVTDYAVTLAITTHSYTHDHDHLMWIKENGTWDTTSNNWDWTGNAYQERTYDGQAVLFGFQDEARTINVTGSNINPSHIRIEYGDYVFTGNSFLTGSESFLSIGRSNTTINQANAGFSKRVDIDDGGHLTLKRIDSVGTARVDIATGGTLRLDEITGGAGISVAFANLLTGDGALRVSGGSLITINNAGNEYFNGSAYIEKDSKLTLKTINSIGSASVDIASGGTLVFDNIRDIGVTVPYHCALSGAGHIEVINGSEIRPDVGNSTFSGTIHIDGSSRLSVNDVTAVGTAVITVDIDPDRRLLKGAFSYNSVSGISQNEFRGTGTVSVRDQRDDGSRKPSHIIFELDNRYFNGEIYIEGEALAQSGSHSSATFTHKYAAGGGLGADVDAHFIYNTGLVIIDIAEDDEGKTDGDGRVTWTTNIEGYWTVRAETIIRAGHELYVNITTENLKSGDEDETDGVPGGKRIKQGYVTIDELAKVTLANGNSISVNYLYMGEGSVLTLESGATLELCGEFRWDTYAVVQHYVDGRIVLNKGSKIVFTDDGSGGENVMVGYNDGVQGSLVLEASWSDWTANTTPKEGYYGAELGTFDLTGYFERKLSYDESEYDGDEPTLSINDMFLEFFFTGKNEESMDYMDFLATYCPDFDPNDAPDGCYVSFLLNSKGLTWLGNTDAMHIDQWGKYWAFNDGVVHYYYNTPPPYLIPEPTTATLGMLGLAGLLLRRRRKAKA